MQVDPSELVLTHYQGGLAILGPGLDRAVSALLPKPCPLATPYHVTLITAQEFKAAGRPVVPSHIRLDRIYALGLGGKRNTRWIVAVWNHADLWRSSLGLPKKDYHITVTSNDIHEVKKGISSLLHPISVQAVAELGEDVLDHVIVASNDCPELQIALSEELIARYPTSYKGYVRLSEYTSDPKLSALCLARAFALEPSISHLVKRLAKLADQTPWGPTTTQVELDCIPPALRPHLLLPWPQELANRIKLLWTCPTASRDRQIHSGYELPRFFSWVYSGRLAGMSTPRNENDIDALVAMGITHVLTLTAETPLDPNWFQYKLEHVYIPIANYGAPTIEEMDNVYARMQDGGAWLVHCGGGVGRAGTILACVMAMLGTEGEESENTTPKLDAGTAIAQLRQMRPRSLESAIQEKFVSSWISHRWKQAYVNTTVEEPCTILQRQGRIPLNTPLVLFLIGKPGSGKSWLASAISKRRPRGKTMVISQDESGSRATCEREAARSYPDDTLVIFDRCNPLPADRKTWLELFSRQSVAVYFDYSGELCRKRMNNRLDHPTLRAGRGGNALEQFEREMTAPTLDEGFQAILTIGSFSASSSAIQLLTSDPPLLKFPRTPHLINLGAVTSDDVVTDVFGSSAPASGSSGGGEIQGRLTLEEKIDGANMGISLDWNRVLRVQNRSHWVSSASQAQFKKLDDWIERHSTILHNLLDKDPEYPERYILYGEWVSTKHSIRYTALPDLFIAFDLYDRLSATFLSRRLLTRALEAASRAASTGTDGDRLVIHQVPLINETECVTREELLTVLKGKGQWTDERLEGVYVRWEDDRREQTIRRGKIVRGDFIAGNEHWSKGHLAPNVLKPD